MTALARRACSEKPMLNLHFCTFNTQFKMTLTPSLLQPSLPCRHSFGSSCTPPGGGEITWWAKTMSAWEANRSLVHPPTGGHLGFFLKFLFLLKYISNFKIKYFNSSRFNITRWFLRINGYILAKFVIIAAILDFHSRHFESQKTKSSKAIIWSAVFIN